MRILRKKTAYLYAFKATDYYLANVATWRSRPVGTHPSLIGWLTEIVMTKEAIDRILLLSFYHFIFFDSKVQNQVAGGKLTSEGKTVSTLYLVKYVTFVNSENCTL